MAAKSADNARKKAMTKTVVKKVSPNVKVLVPGSRPLTQSNTEKAKIVAKAKTKTPAARSADAARKADAEARRKYNIRFLREGIIVDARKEALKRVGVNTAAGDKPTAAQNKIANKAQAEIERTAKKLLAARKVREKAARAAEFKAKSTGGSGMRGGLLGGGGTFGKIR